MLTWFLIFIVTIGTAAYLRLPQVIWSAALGLVLLIFSFSGMAGLASMVIIWALFLAIIVPLNLPHIRQKYISQPLLEFMRSSMPSISKTEQEALDAGKTWWEVDLFSGKPDYSKIRDLPPSKLSDEEQAFLDGPVC